MRLGTLFGEHNAPVRITLALHTSQRSALISECEEVVVSPTSLLPDHNERRNFRVVTIGLVARETPRQRALGDTEHIANIGLPD